MTNELVTTNSDSMALAEQVAVAGDLAQLTPAQRMAYYSRVCESLGINPLTQPFQYIRLNNKLVLYATRTAADQLRRRNSVSLDAPHIEFADGLVIVTVTGHDDQGRTDTEIGAVPLGNLQGEARANAIMKAVTKAKRRLTLSICGLGWLDETEVDSIPAARPVTVTDDGEIVEAAEPEPVRATPPTPPAPAKATNGTPPQANGHLLYGNGAVVRPQKVDDYQAYIDAHPDGKIPYNQKHLDDWLATLTDDEPQPAPVAEAVEAPLFPLNNGAYMES